MLFFARYEASQLGSVTIEPEHLLLSLLRETEGRAAPWLRSVSRDRIREDLAQRMSSATPLGPSVEIPFSAAARRILQKAAEEADALRHGYIGTEHLLLALIGDEQSTAGALLGEYGVLLDVVRPLAAAPVTEQSSGAPMPAAGTPPAVAVPETARPALTAREYVRLFNGMLDAFVRVIDLDQEGQALVARIRRDVETLNTRLTQPDE